MEVGVLLEEGQEQGQKVVSSPGLGGRLEQEHLGDRCLLCVLPPGLGECREGLKVLEEKCLGGLWEIFGDDDSSQGALIIQQHPRPLHHSIHTAPGRGSLTGAV